MADLKKSSNHFFEVLNKLQTAIAVFAMGGLVTLVCVQVFLRYVLNAPLFGIEELQEFFAIWVYFFGGAVASYQKSHIQCGIINVFIKNKKVNYATDIIRDVFSALIAFFMIYNICGYTKYVTKTWKTSSILRIPTVIGENAIIVAVAIMALFAVRDSIDTIKAGPRELAQLGDAELEELKAELGGE